MALRTEELQAILGHDGNVVGTDGKIGGIGQVYLDNATGQPEWVTATTGFFGTSESFVPLRGATLNGDDIVVQYDKATVKDAPRIDADGSLSPEEEERLYVHYNLGDGLEQETADVTPDRAGTVASDVSGPNTDDAMTRSEERLRVGVQAREAGRARLRKFVVSENVTQTVPVRHEEIRIQREPITEANVGSALQGPTITEEVHEIVLHEERPVVAKETVPVERVRLDKTTVTEQVTVSEELRKEQIETEVLDVPDRDRS